MKRFPLLRLIPLLVLLLLAQTRVLGESVTFDGVDDRVSIGPDGTLATTNFTVEAWFKRASGGTTTSINGIAIYPLVARGLAENFGLGVRTNGAIFGTFTNGSNIFSVSSTATAPIGEWHHAAVTYDGASLKVYLDGQLAGQAFVATTPKITTVGTELGRVPNQGSYNGAFAGQMDEVRIWNYARSRAEIDAHKGVGLTFVPGLLARWSFDGTTILTTSSDGMNAIPASLVAGAAYLADAPSFPSGAPTAAITAPLGSTNITRGNPLPLTASASANGGVARVEFYAGATKLGESASAPYGLNAPFPNIGTFAVRAAAVDAVGRINGSNIGPTVTVLPPPGTEAVYFDGVASAAKTNQPSALALAEFTVETWFSIEGAGGMASLGTEFGSVVALVHRGAAVTNTNFLLAFRPSDNRLVGGFTNGGTLGLASGTTAISRGVWHHAAVTFDGTVVRLYLDGNVEAETRPGVLPNLATGKPTQLAALITSYSEGFPLFSGLLNGMLDEVRIWSYARPLGAIRGARFVRQPLAPQLAARWAIDEGAGSTLAESVTPALAATLSGATRWTTGAPLLAGQPPTATLTSPNGPVTVARDQVQALTAGASDPDGSVARVEFWEGTRKLGEATTAPYSLSWPAAPSGNRRISAVAIDNAGLAGASPAVAVTVTQPAGAGGIYLDGDNDRVLSTSAFAINYNSSFTVEGWFRREDLGRVYVFGSAMPIEPLIVNQTSYFFSNQLAYLLGVRPSDRVLVGGYGSLVFAGTTPIEFGVWRHAALSYDGATLRLYLDGQLEAQAAAAPTSAGGWLSFGGHPYVTASPTCFAGHLDEVRVWNYARSATEIAGARAQALASAPGLGARWAFSEGTGTVAVSSGAQVISSNLSAGVLWSAGAPAGSGLAPTVSISSPVADANVPILTSQTATVAAADADGTVARVELYLHATKVAEKTAPPFSFPYSLEALGANTLRAVAVDQTGLATTSAPVTLQGVLPPGGDGVFFNGTSSYAFLPPDSDLALERFTVETWFRKEGTGTPTSAGGYNLLPLVSRGSSGNGFNYLLGIDVNTRRAVAHCSNASVGAFAIGTTAISDSTWHHLAMTYDGQALRVYLNGQLEGTATFSRGPGMSPTQCTAIASIVSAAGGTAGFFRGFIDEVRFWKEARPAAVIAADRWATSFADAGLLARFAMSEGGGTTISSAGSLPPIAGLLSEATWTVGRPDSAHALPAISLNAFPGTVAVGQPVLLTAAPISADGAVSGVEFFAGNTNSGSAKFGEALNPPWTQTFTPPTPGQWTLTAVVTSEFGERAASNSVTIVAAPGAGEGAVYFDGIDDFAEFPASAELAPPAFTVETWFRRDGQGQSVSGMDAVPLVALGRTTAFFAERSHYLLGIDPSSNRLMGLVNGGGTNGITPIQTGVWYHAALVVEGLASRLYLNGVLEATSSAGSGTSVAVPSLATTLDARGQRQGQFHGALDEVRVWSLARTASELSTNAARKIHNAPGLIARWGLDEPAGAAIGDTASFSLKGNLRGGAARTTGMALVSNATPAITPQAPAPDAAELPASVALSAAIAGEPQELLTVTFFGRQIAREAEDFTVAILPETVNYTGGAPRTLTAMLAWIAAHREARNVAFVTHTGSVVDASAANAPEAWLAASESFAQIEDSAATGLLQGLPFGIAAGPRDLPATQPGYNQFFGRTRFAGRSWFAGGDVLTSNANHLELFSAGGVDFAVAHLAHDATLSSTSPSLVWLKTMLARYRARQFIVVTHDLLASSAGLPHSPLGTVVYNNVGSFSNVVLFLGGRTLDELRRVDSPTGLAIPSLAANYSARANGGGGWMRLLEFSPAAGRIRVRTWSPTRGEYETDAELEEPARTARLDDRRKHERTFRRCRRERHLGAAGARSALRMVCPSQRRDEHRSRAGAPLQSGRARWRAAAHGDADRAHARRLSDSSGGGDRERDGSESGRCGRARRVFCQWNQSSE